MDMVLSKIKKAGVSLILKMFCFFSERVNYLRHIIELSALTIDEARVKSFSTLQLHWNLSELRSFL